MRPRTSAAQTRLPAGARSQPPNRYDEVATGVARLITQRLIRDDERAAGPQSLRDQRRDVGREFNTREGLSWIRGRSVTAVLHVLIDWPATPGTGHINILSYSGV